MFFLLKICCYIFVDCDVILVIWLEVLCVGYGFFGEVELQKQKVLVCDYYLDVLEIWLVLDGDMLLGFIGLFDVFIGGFFVVLVVYGCGIGW